MISTYNKGYPDFETDYYYKLGFADATKSKLYWGTIVFTAGFILSYEIMKELLK